MLFCHITTRIKDRKDDGLLSTVGGRGFPHLVAIDATGKLLGSHLAGLKGVSKEQKTAIDGLLVGLEVKDLIEPLQQNRDPKKAEELLKAIGKKLWEMDQAGRVPAGDDDFGAFYSAIIAYAEQEKHIPAFEKCLKALKERFGDRAKGFVEAKEAILEKMKEEKAKEKEGK